MIGLTVLMLTIGGIAAIPSVEQRSKRQAPEYVGTTLPGGPISVEFYDEDQTLRLLHPVLSDRAETIFRHVKFNITRDLGFTSWEVFRNYFTYADFSKQLHIEFSRTDGKGKSYDVRIIPKAFILADVKMSYDNVEEHYINSNTFYLLNDKRSPVTLGGKSVKDGVFNRNHQTIFSDKIWVGFASVGATVDMALEGYKVDDALMFQIMYRINFSSLASTAGIRFKMHGENDITFKSSVGPRY